MKILVVDDEFVSRKKMQLIMSSYGECDNAAGGDEALEAFLLAHAEKEPYDLITMDILMPGIGGIETLKRIRDWERSKKISPEGFVKVLMVTSSNNEELKFHSHYEGCSAYIEKPVNGEKVEKALYELETKKK